MCHPKRVYLLILAWVLVANLTIAAASWSQNKDEELCSLLISVIASQEETPVANADVFIRSYSQGVSDDDDEWTPCYTIRLTTDAKGKAYTDAVGLTGSACELRATAKQGMIYRCDITVRAEGFQEALKKTFFDCKNPHPEASFHLLPQ